MPEYRAMSKILCFYYDQFADFEITLACHKFRQVGQREIVGVAYRHEVVQSESGLRFMPDATVQEAMALEDVEALLIPGGPIQPPEAGILELIQAGHARGWIIAAICNGPHYLARAGLLGTHAYTTTCTPESAKRAGITDPFPRQNYREERVVADRQLVTAKGRAFVDFSMSLFERLGIYTDEAERLRLWQDIRG